MIILAIVVMLFGTKRLRNLGGDLGTAIKGFRNSMSDDTENLPDKTDEDTENAVQAEEAEKVDNK